MPKASKLQANFNAGELAPTLYGRTDADRYKAGLKTCLNYIPTLQGPLIRRPGTKFVAGVKNPAQPPTLVPFNISIQNNYILEFGTNYIRFFTASGQIIVNTNVFQVTGTDSYYYGDGRTAPIGVSQGLFKFFATQPSTLSAAGKQALIATTIGSSAILELPTPYSYIDGPNLKFAQNQDTLYITNPGYPVYKLQTSGAFYWTLSQVEFQDGPYLPLNSYASIGDSATVSLIPPNITPSPGTSFSGNFTTGPIRHCSSCISAGTSGNIRVSSPNHGFQSGDQVVIQGVTGTTEANNGTSTITKMQWPIRLVDTNTFDLVGSTFANAFTGSGVIYPAFFNVNPILGTVWNDVGRTVRLLCAGTSAWGYITQVQDRKSCYIQLSPDTPLLPGTSAVSLWQLGAWNLNPVIPGPNFPSACCFHQDRLFFVGAPFQPQDVNGSVSGDHENFAPTDIGTLEVTDVNALQFTLNSTETNSLRWIRSAAQGLLSGSASAEWLITPNNQAAALTPTNFNAAQTSFYGSANIDAVQASNATLYVSRSGRKVRELNYFFQLGTFRSTDLTELSEHVSLPSINKLVVVRETYPIVWGMNSSGGLISMSYNRDDLSIKVGWARHQLGGQSDSAGSLPIVKSIATIPSLDTTYDQLWMVVQRRLNGSSAVVIEQMTKPFDDGVLPEDAFQVDCGFTYDNPITVNNITNAVAALVTANAHGFANGDVVRFSNVIGLNIASTDINGNVTETNQVNGKTFVVGSSATNTFNMLDFGNVPINTASSSVFVGVDFFGVFNGSKVRKLVSTVSSTNLGLLTGDTVGVLADGGIHPDVVVGSSGTITLQYPASKVQVGYRYNSDGATLPSDVGSAQGSSVGTMSRISRAAVQMHSIGDISVGADFSALFPLVFPTADQQQADNAVPLFSGIVRDGIEDTWDLVDLFCFRQNSVLPGMVQAIALFLEETDV